MKRICLTEEQFRDIIEASVYTAFERLGLITEYGIDINRHERTVTYNPEHQENLDTSLENNPTCTVEEIEGVTVHKFSMFQRKPSKEKGGGDGNPALYALKDEKGWNMTNVDEFIKQFGLVLDKFIEVVQPAKVVIPMPSTNLLNAKIVRILKNKIPDLSICRPIRKMTVEEVWLHCEDVDSYFDTYWKNKGADLNSKYKELEILLDDMKKNNGGIFSYHRIKDMEMRESLINTLIVNPLGYAKYNKYINGNDVLLIDDSITRGQTIRDAVHALKQMYDPKSINVLTMFSELKK